MFPRTDNVLLLGMGDDGRGLLELTPKHVVTDFAIAF
jgi:hypothetical protein